MPKLPTYLALMLNGVCAAGYFTPFSREALRMYQVCGGTSRVSSPNAYNDLASTYLEICSIIEQKCAELKKDDGGK